VIEAWDDELKGKGEGAPRFCQQCGVARPDGAHFCPNCGRGFDRSPTAAGAPGVGAASVAPVATAAPIAEAATSRPELALTLAGLAWISVALVGGYLAYLQWTFSPYAGASAASLQGFALINAVAAVVTLVFGALLLTAPTRGRLTSSIVWGVLSVFGGAVQMAGGATHWTIFVGTAGAAVAAVLAWVARAADPAKHGSSSAV
jgi:hypothetical protein